MKRCCRQGSMIYMEPRLTRQMLLLVVYAAVLLSACAAPPRRANPMTEALSGQIHLFGKERIRAWGDASPRAFNELLAAHRESAELKQVAAAFREAANFLSISGGGANGAYGAGVIVGWTKSGRRPPFVVVTGVSTGALIAPFAFLGPDYDWVPEEVYNFHGTADLVSMRSVLKSVFSDAFFDSAPLRKEIASYITPDEMKAIAAEHHRGRRLLIGTTDMDALRPVVRIIGMIAEQGTLEALDLIRRIILASASIPVAFSPVVIDMPHQGQVYQELHADGGVTNQVFLFPPDLDWDGFVDHFAFSRKPDLYIIRNDRMAADFESTPAKLIPLAKRSIDSLIRTQGIGDLYRLYVTAEANDFDYFLAHVPNDFHVATTELFDPDYMRPLFHLGYEQGKRGGCWYSLPPGLAAPGTDKGSTGCKPGAKDRAE